ncbi:uncharacterized protein LOC123307988 [Coccinella septempunctata]|uniref:uncharacterized protein LOC123307988 n=1 Tax=Coccinella septempunctata TaxID=41139 RepID=UPI001D07406C|nr:uncharacterized protein LOC123307988 [Coccinella septempunctata]
MSKNVESRTASQTFSKNVESISESSEGDEKTKSNSAQSLRLTYAPHSQSSLKLKDESGSTTSTSSGKSRDKHYITKVQPKSASCSFTPIESDERVLPEEDEEYSSKLKKEMNVQMVLSESHEESSSKNGSVEENSTFEDIPLTDVDESSRVKSDESSKDASMDSIPKDINRSSNRILSGPRMTTSDSFISINRKYFPDNGRKCIPPTEIDVRAWENPGSSEKPPAVIVQNKSDADSERTSSLTPVSLFENEKYKTFTDSNSHDDDIIESIKPPNGRKKSTAGKVEFKKGIELKNSSLLSIPSTVCRICHTNTVNERLLSPCYCKGSLAYVHLSCLERWLNQSSRSYCELCLYQYNAVETLRYGFFEGIRLWVRHPRNRNHVKSDCLIAFLLTLVTLGLLVICFIGMDYFMIEGIKLGLSKMWTKSFIVSFLGVIMMGYVVTMYLIVKDQFVPWYTWWKNTLNIRLLLSPTVMQTQRI